MEPSLVILDHLVNRPRDDRSLRLTNLLADFSPGYARHWHFCVPQFFYEALDIQLTPRVINRRNLKVWTQESRFNFSVGDTFYNRPYVYCDNFACSFFAAPPLCLQVERTAPCIPQLKDRPRQPGRVDFKILSQDNGWRLQTHQTLSQDAFLRLLIRGLPL